MGYVHRVRAGRGHGLAVVVGAGGYDSGWDCELVVCLSDGLVCLGQAAKAKERCRLRPGARKATSKTTPKANRMSDVLLETRRK